MMKPLLAFAITFAVGYYLVTKVAPVVQAKVKAFDLDDAWDIFDNEWDGS